MRWLGILKKKAFGEAEHPAERWNSTGTYAPLARFWEPNDCFGEAFWIFHLRNTKFPEFYVFFVIAIQTRWSSISSENSITTHSGPRCCNQTCLFIPEAVGTTQAAVNRFQKLDVSWRTCPSAENIGISWTVGNSAPFCYKPYLWLSINSRSLHR